MPPVQDPNTQACGGPAGWAMPLPPSASIVAANSIALRIRIPLARPPILNRFAFKSERQPI
jgi:hypothetical protein